MKSLLQNLVSRVFVLAAVTLALPACRSDAEAVCDYKCECEGCNDVAVDDCYWKSDNEARDADNKDCIDLYDELQACEYETGFCSGSDWKTSCGVEHDRFKNCMN
jgi:hypothetical protein